MLLPPFRFPLEAWEIFFPVFLLLSYVTNDVKLIVAGPFLVNHLTYFSNWPAFLDAATAWEQNLAEAYEGQSLQTTFPFFLISTKCGRVEVWLSTMNALLFPGAEVIDPGRFNSSSDFLTSDWSIAEGRDGMWVLRRSTESARLGEIAFIGGRRTSCHFGFFFL